MKKGQSTIEYGVLIAVISAAFIFMGIYIRQGMQGRIRENTDQMGGQFNPGNFNYSWKTTANSLIKENIMNDGKINITYPDTNVNGEKQNKTQKIGNENTYFWTRTPPD